VDDSSPWIERGAVEPLVAGPVPGRPDDRVESVEFDLGLHAPDGGWFGSVRCRQTGVQFVLGRELVDSLEQAILFEVGVGDDVGERPRELSFRASDLHQFADDVDAGGNEGVEIEGATLWAADELEGRQSPRLGDVVDLVVPLIELTDHVHPPVDVSLAVLAGEPDVAADCEGDVA